MNTAAVQTKRKNIDIREDVYRFLSIKEVASGTNLKSYIKALLEKEVEDMNEAATYQYLCNVRSGMILFGICVRGYYLRREKTVAK